MSLLPSEPDLSADAEPRVVDIDDDDADELMAALSSTTARRLLSTLHDDPAPPSELAERLDTSLQNTQYHLENLESAGAIEVVGTAYSEKGREMSVYGPADRPLVLFAGESDDTSGLREALSRLFGGVFALVVGSIVVQALFGDRLLGPETQREESAPDVADAPEPVPETADAAEPSLIETILASGVPPGFVFFLGGFTVLFVLVAVTYWRDIR
ncbi:MAG: helix-turn-helix domain-containing protein [Natronomonas sp.]